METEINSSERQEEPGINLTTPWYKMSGLSTATLRLLYILKDFENASPRLNPLITNPENVSEIIIIAYHSLTILLCVLEISWL